MSKLDFMLSSLKNRGKGNAFFLIDKSFEG